MVSGAKHARPAAAINAAPKSIHQLASSTSRKRETQTESDFVRVSRYMSQIESRVYVEIIMHA